MKYCLVSVLLIFANLVVSGQKTTKLLIIDTVESNSKDFTVNVTRHYSSYPETNMSIVDSFERERFLPAKIYSIPDFKKYPNLQIPIAAPDTGFSLVIELDDSGGYLAIPNAFFIQTDTIRISKLTVFHNCIADTTRSSVTWFRRNPLDTINSLTSLKHKKKPDIVFEKNCTVTYPQFISLEINNKKYIPALVTIEKNAGAVMWYHGHKKMGKRRERRYKQQIAEDKPYVYFAGKIGRMKYVLHAEVNIE